MCRIIAFENKKLYIDGVKRIIHISDDVIRIDTGKKTIEINGQYLHIDSMNNIEVIIGGVINTIGWLNK